VSSPLELLIDTVAPTAPTLATAQSLNTSPELSGTVEEISSSVQVGIAGKTYAATNNGDGTWILAQGMITPALTPGEYPVVVSAMDTAGNIGSVNGLKFAVLGAATTNTASGDATNASQLSHTGMNIMQILAFGLLPVAFGLFLIKRKTA